MRLKVTAAALLLAFLPAAAMASCNWEHSNESANQCPEGHAYDATSGTCVKLTTS